MSTTELLAPDDHDLASAPARDMSSTPTIEQTLSYAVEKGMDPAGLEKLMALYERVQDRRAAQAFNLAMKDFKKSCPPILKSKTAWNEKTQKVMYHYADFAEITGVVDPVLAKFGLSYGFDMTMGEKGSWKTTCTVQHIDGHSKSASFECPATGTSLMNAPQQIASASTYGRRYSLQFALGLSLDPDDDGRGADPMPRAAHDPSAPRVSPRGERPAEQTATDPNQATAAQVTALCKEYWATLSPNVKGTKAMFCAWAKDVLQTTVDMSQTAHWTIDAIDACREQIKQPM